MKYWKEYVKENEGLKLYPYRCSAGKLTIGYGHNLDGLGISRAVADLMFEEDFDRAYGQAAASIRGFLLLNGLQQMAIVDMVFNMGIAGVLNFKKMIAAIAKGDHEEAANQILDSKYAKQCPTRARKNASLLRTGTEDNNV